MAGKRTTEKGLKRTTTDAGMGAVRPSRMPPSQRGNRPPPIECPAPRVPQIEDVSTPRAGFGRRGTINQSGSDPTEDAPISSGGSSDQDVESGWDAPVTTMSIPSLTEAARDLDGAPIKPRDAFLLSRIDGELNAGDIADLTGMPGREVLGTLQRLASVGLITLR